MSRRASFFNKQNPGKPRVRFADELVFNDNVKEQDIPAMEAMLRRSSLQMDINSINSAGLTPLHQAVLDGNIAVTKLLIAHGADVNKQDEDFWTPLHAACAEGHSDIVRYLLTQGADRQILTDNGERPLDLVEPTDFSTIKAMLEDIAASASQADNSDEEDDDDNDDDADNDDDEGEGNRGRRRNYGEDEADENDDYEPQNDRGDDDDDDDDGDDDDRRHRHREGKDNMHRSARLLEDEDVMGDLEYVSPDEEDEEEEENRRQRRLRQSERSRSGSKSTSEQEVHYRSEEDRLDVEDSEFEQRMPRQKHEQFYGSQGEEEISDEEQFELQENYYQQNPDLNYDIENENDEPPTEFDEDLSDRSDRECRRPQRHYIDGGSDDERKERFYYIEGEESDELNRHHHRASQDEDHRPYDSGEERYYREINKDANNNSNNNEDSQAQQYKHQQCSSEFRGDLTEKEHLSNINEHSENEHLQLPKPGEISADEITA